MKRLVSYFLIILLFVSACSGNVSEKEELENIGEENNVEDNNIEDEEEGSKDLVVIVEDSNVEASDDYVRVIINPSENASLGGLEKGESLVFDLLKTLTWNEAMESGFYIPEIDNVDEGYVFENWDFEINGEKPVEDKHINAVFEVEQMDLVLYFIKEKEDYAYLVREVHQVDKRLDTARASLEELISSNINTKDASSPIPENTKILGLNIEDKKIIVDFSSEIMDLSLEKEVFAAKINAIVNTLTEFDSVDQVEILIEGSKDKGVDWLEHYGYSEDLLTRDLSNVFEPAIWFESPKEGEVIENKIHVKGSMIVFESNAGYTLEDSNGNILSEGNFMGENHEGLRGFFDFTIDFEKPDTDEATLSIYGFSGKDGSKTDITSVSVRFR